MAVDTRNKRFSMIVIGSWKGRVLPNPDGGFSTALDRIQVALNYALGAAASTSVLTLVGRYQPTLTPAGVYVSTISLVGRIED